MKEARALRDLLSNPGWGVFNGIFQGEVKKAADDLLHQEGVELYRAQGARRVLETLNEKVNNVLDMLKEKEEEDGEEERSEAEG